MFKTLLKNSFYVVLIPVHGILLFSLMSCSEPSQPLIPVPANSNQALLDAIGGHTQKVILGSSDGPQVIITPELSARILGAAINGALDENLMWVEPSILDGSFWRKKPYFWNAGGLRTWIAPEDLFFVDADKNPDSWFVPQSIDPAPFSILLQTEKEAVFEAEIELPANIGKTYSFTLMRHVSLVAEPPGDVGSLSARVSFMGIELTHSLTNRSDDVIGVDLPYICLWSLLQLNPSGTTLVPLKKGADPQTAYREYFNPLGDRLVVANNIISVKIDGKYRCKIGVRPEAATEGIAFLRDDGNNQGGPVCKKVSG